MSSNTVPNQHKQNEFKYYRDAAPLEYRTKMSARLRTMHSHNNIPVICETMKRSVFAPQRLKFLCPKDITFAQLLMMIRNKLDHLTPGEALVVYVGDKKARPPSNWTMQDVDNKYRSKDGFVYLEFDAENTFG